jgi:hypothetical protein
MLRHRRKQFIELDLGTGVWPVPSFTTNKAPEALRAMLVQVRLHFRMCACMCLPLRF